MQHSAHPTPQQIVEHLYRAFNRGDFKTMIEHLADKFDWNVSDNFLLWDPTPYRTPAAAAAALFKCLVAQVRGCVAIPTDLFDAGETIVVLGRVKGMFNATGRSFDAEYAHVWHVRNEKVVGFRQIIDSLAVWRAQQGL